MDKAIKKRLSLLEMGLKQETCFCLVQLPDGTKTEKPVEEWYQNASEWRFLRMTRDSSNRTAVLLVLAAIGSECAQSMELSENSETAARLKADANYCLEVYNKKPKRKDFEQ